jgi:hypothetical protein
MPLIPPNRVVVFPLKDDLQWYDPEVVFRPFDDLFGRGVMGPTDLQVIANGPADGQITVKAGRGYVPYTSGGKRYFSTPVDIRSSDPEFQRSIQSWPGGNPRIDRVVAKILDATMTPGDIQKGGVFDVIPGTPTSGATLVNLSGAAAVPGNSVLLGNVLANGATIPTGNIDSGFGTVRARAIIGQGNAPSVSFEKNGVALTQRPVLNFIEGTGISITAADDPTNNELDLTIASTPSVQLLRDYTVVGASKATIDTYSDFGNTLLPTTYGDLVVTGYVQSTFSGDDADIEMIINNDTGAVYDNNSLRTLPPSVAWTARRQNDSDTSMYVGDAVEQLHPTRWSTFELKILNYANVGSAKLTNVLISAMASRGAMGITPIVSRIVGAGVYNGTAPVTRLRFNCKSGNFSIGSRIRVWGM